MDASETEKKDRLRCALSHGMAMIHLDARRPGVLVPDALRSEVHLRLNLSYRFEPPDLAIGDWGVRCTLSFSGKRFTVAVPWSALFAITSHVGKEFWMFPEDMPRELLEQVGQPTRRVGSVERVSKSGTMLREVKCGPCKDEDPKPRGPRHLRLIK
jgi:stringent starvation protein B